MGLVGIGRFAVCGPAGCARWAESERSGRMQSGRSEGTDSAEIGVVEMVYWGLVGGVLGRPVGSAWVIEFSGDSAHEGLGIEMDCEELRGLEAHLLAKESQICVVQRRSRIQHMTTSTHC